MLNRAYRILFAWIMLSVVCARAMVAPHPLYQEIPANWQAAQPEIRQVNTGKSGAEILPLKNREELPNNILALMVEFSDVRFKVAQYPDYIPHDLVFFERWMQHLQDFFTDASHGRYEMDSHVHPEVIRLFKNMAWYGADTSSKIDANLPYIIEDIVELVSDQINFSDYDGLIIFHAGAGQESDIESRQTDEIWSTFLSRRTLQATFDPENDDYPGYITPDGAVLTNIVIVPEDEFQPYFPSEGEEDADFYLFSIYGVLAHQFGHVLGLPTLFDNDSSNGRSQGIGNWGLMGTGVWNGSGYIPAQLSAWCRYYLGWEDAVEILADTDNLPLDHFLNHDPYAIRLYKVPISDFEYFLIENRQQNPDGSTDPYNYLPSYSFKLLSEGEQDYYADKPKRPYFNFMKNRYTGSEWDFFLPGYGMDPLTDGSGILIWHIDERVIAEKFTPNFDRNSINGDSRHKGVDLEEADGVQHLDSVNVHDYKYGGPYDSYRAGNNDYFGNEIHEGVTWLPTAASYYGGIPLEIYDISASANQMYFSVRFEWSLDAVYDGENPLPAAAIDFYGDGEEAIFYPMPDGKLALFKDEMMAPGFPLFTQNIPQLYVWDDASLYIPVQHDTLLRLRRLNNAGSRYPVNLEQHCWLSHPVDFYEHLLLPVKSLSDGQQLIYQYDKSAEKLLDESIELPKELKTNLSRVDKRIYALLLGSEDEYYSIFEYDAESQNSRLFATPIPADSTAFALYSAYLLGEELSLILQCPQSIWVLDLKDETLTPRPGFPFALRQEANAPLSIADFLENGSAQIFVNAANRLHILDYSGRDISLPSMDLALEDDGIQGGVLVMDLDGDGRKDIASAFSLNRLALWKNNQGLFGGYPRAFGSRSRNMPLVKKGSDGKHYLWLAADKGKIYRTPLNNYQPGERQELWNAEYADLGRSAHFAGCSAANSYHQEKGIFVKDQCYVFPNPLKNIYEPVLRIRLMPTADTNVSLKVYDIRGNLVYEGSGLAYAYLQNQDLFVLPAERLQSGVYIAVIKAAGETLKLKFAIEK